MTVSYTHLSGIVVPEYPYFVEKFNEMVTRLKQLAQTPADIDTMQSEDCLLYTSTVKPDASTSVRQRADSVRSNRLFLIAVFLLFVVVISQSAGNCAAGQHGACLLYTSRCV